MKRSCAPCDSVRATTHSIKHIRERKQGNRVQQRTQEVTENQLCCDREQERSLYLCRQYFFPMQVSMVEVTDLVGVICATNKSVKTKVKDNSFLVVIATEHVLLGTSTLHSTLPHQRSHFKIAVIIKTVMITSYGVARIMVRTIVLSVQQVMLTLGNEKKTTLSYSFPEELSSRVHEYG